MSGLEIALILLVSVWTLIFVIIAVMIFIIFLALKKTVTKFNNLLDTTEAAAQEAQLPLKMAMAGIAGMMSKNAFDTIRKIASIATSSRRKK